MKSIPATPSSFAVARARVAGAWWRRSDTAAGAARGAAARIGREGRVGRWNFQQPLLGCQICIPMP